MSLALAVGVHATCNPFCGDKTQGWDKKCDWGGCYSCTECSAPAPVCNPFCEDKTQAWDAKCTWEGCNGCTDCSSPAPVCKPFCEDKTQAWDAKCTWEGCNGCTECSSPAPVCKPFCEDKTQAWDDKCTWGGCNGCTDCFVPPPSPPFGPKSCTLVYTGSDFCGDDEVLAGFTDSLVSRSLGGNIDDCEALCLATAECLFISFWPSGCVGSRGGVLVWARYVAVFLLPALALRRLVVH
ncbi:hypothetical protein EMIHUDRAFT_252613 [Emiliania huxleyi CCMP1516]|uniref:Apple domain-containing protein n=2 Tax=Emiliania huxleyi TaxID=2903 RepID=A0A0D3KIL0_EMIH1|nr:hypothetical protein EMIHUDRAFT_252613 [Emiliania huxleyi CCMP1516]EOD35595.1 hypothetical protein EMIHUDRAFT_252613 [Emiliania huxleyi CCMP1516]|eukprot:XP_005788024.1 hypothetical protein EMIHUDRAFT_252613 [Emiliania huxleyi CCMP1516]